MANPEHIEVLKQGEEVWNKWIKEIEYKLEKEGKDIDFPIADLSGIDLSNEKLKSIDLAGVDLSGSKLVGTVISNSYLSGVDLQNANCTGALFEGTELYRTDFSGSTLSDCILQFCVFAWNNLQGTKFDGARFYRCIFSNIDFSAAIGLDSTVHRSPSTLGVDCITRSKGNIPEAFLRGCGVPENFITYMKSLTMNPIEFYSCFISHSTSDAEFAERLYTDLQHNNVRCWYAPENINGGKKIYPQIDEAIRIHDKLVLILSESSINSPWVATEIKRTRKYETQEKRQRLFPISLMSYDELRDWELFDADTGTDLAAEVRSYFIPDFSNWKDHDSYKLAFDRLLRDLKATD